MTGPGTDPLDVLQAALDAATPGPWISDSHEIYQAIPGLPDITGDWLGETCRIEGDPNHATSDADAAAIVALRNAALDLLAAIRNVRALAEEWQDRQGSSADDYAAGVLTGERRCGAALTMALRAALGSFGDQQ